MPRMDGRANDQLRPVEIIPNVNKFAEGSCLIRCGNTHVLCTASVEDRPPRHVPEGEGWVTAEYSMLPRANRERSRRDISKLKLSGRSAEIQRLIGRALRSVVDRKKLGPWNVTIDCDVLQGDGGTRTASITGGYVALVLALKKMQQAGQLREWPVSSPVAAVSDTRVEKENVVARGNVLLGKGENAFHEEVCLLQLVIELEIGLGAFEILDFERIDENLSQDIEPGKHPTAAGAFLVRDAAAVDIDRKDRLEFPRA